MVKRAFRFLFTSCLAGLIFVLLPAIWIARQIFLVLYQGESLSFWTGAPVLTSAINCRVERSLGFRAFTVVHTTYFITNSFDFVLDKIGRAIRLPSSITAYPAFLAICLTAKHVHAYFDGGILPSTVPKRFSRTELISYRLLGIKLFVWTYGGDVRTRETTVALGKPNCCTECTQVGVACICAREKGARNYKMVSWAATQMFSMGDMIEYTPGSRNDLFFWPIDLDREDGERYRAAYPSGDAGNPLRVVHAPNHREFKGTRYLERAVAELQSEGVPIDLVLVERVPNAEAVEIYKTADVIFDQCLIGFHGYFALEAMALGKPVMCFIRKPKSYLLAYEECPIINTQIGSLKDDLRKLVTNRAGLETLGRQGRDYIEKYYSLAAFSGRLKAAYQKLGIDP